jgi:general secretion pathway protein G
MHRSLTVARSRRAGFSLAEIMIVVVIIGLLLVFVAPNALKKFFVAQRTRAKMDITGISSAVKDYVLDHGGKYPSSIEELVTPDDHNQTYLDRTTVPNDPWKNPYIYEPPSGGQSFRIISYGRDGAPGGEGDDADIDNIMIQEGN